MPDYPISEEAAGAARVELSPKRKARKQKAMRAQEKRWKAKCGPVTVRWIEPEPRKMQGKRAGR